MPAKGLLILLCCFTICTGNMLFAQTPKLIIPIGHTGEILSASFSPDGKKILTVSADGTAKLWDAGTGIVLKNYKSGGDASSVNVTAATFSPDGHYVSINYEDHELSIWETITGKRVWDWSGTASDDWIPVRTVDKHFSADGKRIAMFSSYYADTIVNTTDPVIYNMADQRPVFSLKGHKAPVTSLCFSPDGKYIITASADSTLKTWNTRNGKMITTVRFKTDSIQVLWVIPNSQSVMITVKGIAKILDIQTGKQRNLDMESGMKQAEIVYEVDVYGKFIAGLSGYFEYNMDNSMNGYETVTIWNAQTGKRLYKKHGLAAYEDGTLFSPNGKQLILIKADSTVDILDAATGKLIEKLKGFKSLVRTAAYSANNEKIITTLCDGFLNVWDATTGKLNPALSSDTTTISANCDEGYNYIYDMNTKKKYFDLHQLKNYYQVRFLPNGGIDAILRNRSVMIWDAATGKLISDIQHGESVINDAVISNDGKYLLVALTDHTAKLWDIHYGKYISEFKGRSNPVSKAWFSSDNSRLFLLTGQGEKVLSMVNGKLITDSLELSKAEKLKFIQDNKSTDGVSLISPDGSISLNWGADIVQLSPVNELGEAKLSGTGTGLGPQNGRMDHVVNSVVFSADSKQLLLTVADNTTRIFDIEKDHFISTIIVFDSLDYINQLADGYYQVTPNAAKMLHYLTKDSKLISFEQLDAKYNRPDKVLETMGNKDPFLIASYYNAYLKRIEKLGIDTSSFKDDFDMPEAEIVNKDAIAAIQEKDQLRIHFKASDSKYILDRFNCWINEVPLFGMKGVNIRKQGIHSLDTVLIITLSAGENKIETSVTNTNGIESYRKPLQVTYSRDIASNINVRQEIVDTTKVYFIGVGINMFADSSYNLKWCVQDIRDLAKTMREKYGSRLIIIDTLFNERATRTNIRNMKNKLFSSGVNDQVVFSYSGHGLLSKDYDYYLSSYTVNFKDPEQGGIPYDEIENMLDSIPARKKILLIDACNSGEVDKDEMKKIQMASGGLANNQTSINTSGRGIVLTNTDSTASLGLQNSFDLMQSLFVNVGKGTGAVIIAAAGGVQFAQERSELGHGVFTYSVIEAMKNHPSMKVSELKKYIGDRVTELTNGLQKPTTRNEPVAADWNVW